MENQETKGKANLVLTGSICLSDIPKELIKKVESNGKLYLLDTQDRAYHPRANQQCAGAYSRRNCCGRSRRRKRRASVLTHGDETDEHSTKTRAA